MNVVFYLSAVVAMLATVMVVTSVHAVRALLYLIVSLLAVALVFYVLGAPLAAALEVIIYAGAIVVLFLFVVMLLNLGREATSQEIGWLSLRAWIGPAILAGILMGELIYASLQIGIRKGGAAPVEPTRVGRTLLGPYLLGVELASMLLLAGLVGAYHLGVRGSGFGVQAGSKVQDPRRTPPNNPEPRTPNPERSSEPRTLNPPLNPEPRTLNPEP